jgi:hypothetical protein
MNLSLLLVLDGPQSGQVRTLANDDEFRSETIAAFRRALLIDPDMATR